MPGDSSPRRDAAEAIDPEQKIVDGLAAVADWEVEHGMITDADLRTALARQGSDLVKR